METAPETSSPNPLPQIEEPVPLLPPLLTGASAYLWLWVLPIGLLLLLNLQGYWLIEGNMDEAQKEQALWLGLHNLLNLGLGVGLMLLARSRWREAVPGVFWATVAIGAQVALLWHATAIVMDLLPRSVTAWLYPESRYFYHHYAFCMLPLFWGILRIACGRARFLSRSIGKNLLLAVLAPVVLYLGFQLLDAFDGGPFDNGTGIVVIISVIVALGMLMFVGLIRALMLIFKNLANWGVRQQVIAICLIALAMPIGGLLLNRNIPFPVNFQAWEVYALVLVNTLFLLRAVYWAEQSPRLSFWLLCASFPFTLYFFVVFLPYTPLSILGVIAMGAGFLVLTPTFLFTLHLYQLVHSHRLARARGIGGRGLLLGGVLAFLCLPGFFTLRAVLDKSALNTALDYVYTPDYEMEAMTYPGSRANLQRALSSHRNYKNGIYYPLLSDYYSWLVFDNLVLPDDKIARLEAVFFGSEGSTENLDPLNRGLGIWGSRGVRDRHRMPSAPPPSREVDLIRQELQLEPVDGRSTRARLTLTLDNVGPDTWNGAEYINRLQVPPGILVDGFRLHIKGTPVPGRIFEKKTALWVYTMIRDAARRDPGILVYNHPQEIELRVFPILKGEPTTVEIDFLIPVPEEAFAVPEPLPDPSALLPRLAPAEVQLAEGEDYRYLAPIPEGTLPAVERSHYLHFIIDRSQDNGYDGPDLAKQIDAMRAQFPGIGEGRITLANYNVHELSEAPVSLDRLSPLWAGGRTKLPLGGGFELDRALAHSLAAYARNRLDLGAGDFLPPEPVFVLLGQDRVETLPELEKTRIWQSHLSQLQIYSLGGAGTEGGALMEPGPLPGLVRIGQAIRPAHLQRSLIFPTSEAAPEYYDPIGAAWRPLEHQCHAADSVWGQAIRLWVANHRYAASPGSAGTDLGQLVAESRRSGVLIPATSYIVVENEAQWRMLEQKEDQKLGQNEALDFLETPEPGTLYLVVGFGAWLVWRRRRAIRRARRIESARVA